MLRVYIAAPFQMQAEAIATAADLKRAGIECTSRWFFAGPVDTPEWADYCLADVARADMLVALNPETYRNSGTGARHGEFALALFLGKPTVIVGVRSNLFHQRAAAVLSKGDDLPTVLFRLAVQYGLEAA